MGNLVKFRGGGIVLRSLPVVLDCGFPEIYTGAYPCFSKLSVYFKLRGKRGLMPSWVSACCKDRAISWFASGVVRLNSRGWGCFKVWCVTALECSFCAVCMQAMKHSVANVPSQQAVKLEVLGPLVSLSNVVVDWEISGNEKWGELGKIAIGVANTRAVP